MNTDKEMNANKEFSVSLRIESKALTCSEISKILDWSPSKQFEKGEPVYKRNPKKLRKEHFWIYDFKLDETMLFEKQVKLLVDMILKKENKFKELYDCDIDIFCGYTTFNGQGGFILESKLMGELSLLNIDFLIEFYSIEE